MPCLQKKTSMVAIFTLFLLIGLVFAFTMLAPVAKAENDDVVSIPDENLEAAIRDAIEKPEGDILPEDMESLSVLIITGAGVENLTGLEYALNLEELNLRTNQVSDLSPLEGLISLRDLNVDTNQISDLSPLEGLINLQRLRLGNNQISDISLLGNLINVQRLWLNNNDVDDISALANMTDMERIWLSGNQVSDIAPLEDLTSMQELFLADNQVSDVTALSGMTSLQWLTLGTNQVSDISALTGLTGLRDLYLDGNLIVDVTPLEGLIALQRLRLADNEISDISALSFLTNLTRLTLQYNYLDISEDSETMSIINDLIAGGTDVEYEPQKEIEDDPNGDPDPNGDSDPGDQPAPNPEGTIESGIIDVDGTMVEVSLEHFATAYFEGEGNIYFDYLSSDNDFMLVYAIRSGDKYIGIGEYAENYIDDVGDALENAEPLPESEVNEILQLVGFEDDGTPILENG